MATTHKNEVAARVTSDKLLHASVNTILFTRSCVIIASRCARDEKSFAVYCTIFRL
jgi:hypothetical protein